MLSHPTSFHLRYQGFLMPYGDRLLHDVVSLRNQKPLVPKMTSFKLFNTSGSKAAASKSQTAAPSVILNQRRQLWGWLNSVFNRVDEDRRKEVGPDRACAEWLLRCGGRVRWKGLDHWEKDYNSLPLGSADRYKVEEIDGTKSAIMGIGFPHLEGLKHVKKIILHDCGYLDNEALTYLPVVKDTLQHLQISSCGDITDSGLSPLTQLSNLQKLVLYDLPEIRNKGAILESLKSSLPKCDIDYLDAEQKEEQL